MPPNRSRRDPPGTGRAADPALVRDSAEPLYQQLAALLARQIDEGVFPEGGRLPTEPELMTRHAVSRVTVRQAIALLARNGRVKTMRGKGTFVAAPVLHHDLGVLRGFYDALRDQGIEPETELLEFEPGAGRADRSLPEGMDLPVRLRRRYSLDGRPFALVTAWLPAKATALGEQRAARLTVYEILSQFLGERVASADVAIRCEMATRPIARELGLGAGSPVLVMERRSLSPAQRLLEFMRIHIVPERYEFRLRVPGPLEIARALRRTGQEVAAGTARARIGRASSKADGRP